LQDSSEMENFGTPTTNLIVSMAELHHGALHLLRSFRIAHPSTRIKVISVFSEDRLQAMDGPDIERKNCSCVEVATTDCGTIGRCGSCEVETETAEGWLARVILKN
jgi:hypothetical protein